MKFEKWKLEDIRPAEYNPRKALGPEDAEYQKIMNSILQFGYIDPIIINKDGTIIGGHQRHRVLTDLGYTEVDVVVLDLDKNNEKALNIALNKISGEWDEEKLKDLLMDLDIKEFDISLTGFDNKDLEELAEKLSIPETTSEDDFDADAAYEEVQEPVAKRGDIWILGNHRLMCGDSTSLEDWTKLMNGEQIDLVITDPPYNVNYGDKSEYLDEYLDKGHRNNNHILNDNMDNDSFYKFLFDFYTVANLLMRAGAAMYVFHAETERVNFTKAFTDAGFKFSEVVIWEKNTFVLGRNDYHWRHEPCIYGWKEGAAHYFINDRTQDTVIVEDAADLELMKKQELIAYIQDMQRKYANQTSVIYENKPQRNDIHPTMKPVELIGKLMSNSSKPGWNVADFFGGSGSTLMAAEQLGRNAFIMEMDEKYVDVIIRRWEEFTGLKAVKLEEAPEVKL